MDDSVVSPFYSDSQEPVKVGDLVFVDGHPGRVEGVYMPGTPEADSCTCEDTGALSILYDDGNSIIHPFGVYHVVVKRPEG